MCKKVAREQMDTLPFIIAVDFDGTLVQDKYPEIGEPNEKLFELMKLCRESGIKVVLWTCRTDEYLEQAVEYCKNLGLEFDAVNQNIPEVQKMFGMDTRKVYANMYIDDKNQLLADIMKGVWGCH